MYMDDNIRRDMKEKGLDGANWIHLAKDMNQCRTLVNKTIKPSSHIQGG
jgi:hypothetical protein